MTDKEKLMASAPKPHIPQLLPLPNLPDILLDREIISLIARANNSLGAYKGFLMNSLNPMLLISPLISQEAVLSSKMEGTHATIEDFMNFEAGNTVPIEKDEMHEILNYRQALFFALDKMSIITDESEAGKKKLPLSTRLIKDIHKILLSNVRGSTKLPGEFKREQNYIGGPTSITFTPLPANLTADYMSNLEKYIHYDEVDVLLQSALIHCQFEMIHPFLDGNGRIGRLLIPLFLYYKNVLPFPTFYMSSFFESDRNLYLQMLSTVSHDNDYGAWIKYFLNGVIIQSNYNTAKAQNLMNLYNEYKELCIEKIASKSAIPFLDEIFKQPVFKINQMKDKLNVSIQTLYNISNDFIKYGILIKTPQQRNTTYICTKIIDII